MDCRYRSGKPARASTGAGSGAIRSRSQTSVASVWARERREERARQRSEHVEGWGPRPA